MQSCPHVAILSFTVFPICFQQRMQMNIHFLQSTFLKVTAIFLFFTDFILNTFSFIRSAHNKSTRDSGPSFQIIICSKSQLPVNLSLFFLLAFRYSWFSNYYMVEMSFCSAVITSDIIHFVQCCRCTTTNLMHQPPNALFTSLYPVLPFSLVFTSYLHQKLL